MSQHVLKNKGGNRHRRFKKHKDQAIARELVLKEEDQTYGKVIQLLGNNRIKVFCYDQNKTRIAMIRKSNKLGMISVDDIVLLSLRVDMTNDNKCDVIYKYARDEITSLKEKGEIRGDFNENRDEKEEDIGFDFDSI